MTSIGKVSSSHRIKTLEIFETEVLSWIEKVLQQKLESLTSLGDGVVLCKLLEKIKPGILKEDFKHSVKTEADKEFNAKLFLQGCLAYGLDRVCGVEDILASSSNPAALIGTIQNLASAAEQQGFKPTLRKTLGGELTDSMEKSTTGHTSLSHAEREERLRQLTVEEIFATERDYVRDLEVLVEIFLKPIKNRKLLDQDSISILFSNVEMIHGIHKQFLKKLEEKLEESSAQYWTVGEVFLKFVDFLKIYTNYIANQEQCTHLLRKLQTQQPFGSWLDTAQQNEALHRLGLADYLVKPVQRICKYPLFIKELLKHTRETSTDYENLKQVLLKIESVVGFVNEDKRIKERSARALEVVKGVAGFEDTAAVRHLLKEGELTIISASFAVKKEKKEKKGEKKVLYCFLFSDLFLLCKPKNGGGPLLGTKRGTLNYEGQIELQGCYCIDIPDQKDHKFIFAIRKGNETKVSIQAKTLEEKTNWMNEFLKAIEMSSSRMRASKHEETGYRGSGRFESIKKQKDVFELLASERKVIKQLEEWKQSYLTQLDSLKKSIDEVHEEVQKKKTEIAQLRALVEEKKQQVVETTVELMELKDEGSDLESMNSSSSSPSNSEKYRSLPAQAPLRSWNKKVVADYQGIEAQLQQERKAVKSLEEWKSAHLSKVDELKKAIRVEVDQKLQLQEQILVLEREIALAKKVES